MSILRREVESPDHSPTWSWGAILGRALTLFLVVTSGVVMAQAGSEILAIAFIGMTIGIITLEASR